jgi:hypothetical protein
VSCEAQKGGEVPPKHAIVPLRRWADTNTRGPS